MTTPDPADHDVPNSSVDSELIVHLPHVELVKSALHGMNVGIDRSDQDEQLALARLTLADTADVNSVLTQLRAHFAGRYGQWVPLMDTNRHVGPVIGMPQPRTMAIDDDPQLVTDPVTPVPFTPAGRGIRVGVLDTTIDAHPELIGRFLAEPDSRYQLSDQPVPLRAGHATFVASLVTRMAPAVTVDAHAVLDPVSGKATSWDTAQAMMRFADSGVDILNLSLGCRTSDGLPPLVISRAVELLSQRMVIVAAAGNHGGTTDPDLRQSPTWPAALPDVVAVGARDVDDTLAPFSPKLPWVTCTAPGVALLGAYLTALVSVTKQPDPVQFTGYARWSGTSFATASVSGAIAAAAGKIGVRAALEQLLASSSGVVRPFTQCDDDGCA